MATALNKSMELEGNLRTFQLPDILRFLAMGRMTGTLTLSSGTHVVDLQIKEGRLCGSNTPERFIKLGQLLVYNGQLSRKDLADVLELQRASEGEQMLGELLIDRKLVSAEDVQQALLLQIKEELWELFSWIDGKFLFEHGTTAALKRAMVELEIEPLLEEGAEKLEQWRALQRNMGNGAETFQACGEINTLPEVRLTPNQWRVLALVNGRLSVQSLVMHSGIGRFETFSAIEQLQQHRLIEQVPQRRKPSQHPGQHANDLRIIPIHGAKNEPANHEAAEAHDSSLFGRLKRRKRTDEAPEVSAPARTSAVLPAEAPPKSFLTAVGWGCALLNRLADCLAKETGEVPDLAAVWSGAEARYPKADLVQAAPTMLQADEFERFVELAGGIDAALAAAFDESMAALAAVGGELVGKAHQALGTRAEQFVNDVMRPYLDHMDVKYPTDFMARAWSEKMKVAVN